MMPASDTGKGDRRRMPCAKIWKEIERGREWIVDADLKDFFGSVDHEKLLTLVAQRISDGRVLRLIEAMLKAGALAEGQRFPTEQGTPQGGVVSPLFSNILLTPFDREMRRRGFRLTRYADDWVVTCDIGGGSASGIGRGHQDPERAGRDAHPRRRGSCTSGTASSFSGTRSSAGRRLRLPPGKIRSGAATGALYAYPAGEVDRALQGSDSAADPATLPVKTRS